MTYGYPPAGAAAFIELDDVPNTYDGNGQRAVVVDEAGTGLAFTERILVTDSGEVDIESAPDQPLIVRNDGTGGISIRADDAGGVMVQGSGDGGVTLRGDGAGGVNLDARGSYGLDALAGTSGINRLRMTDDTGVSLVSSKGVTVTAGDGASAGGPMYLDAGNATGADGIGGDARVTSGGAAVASDGDGGEVFITAGSGDGTGTGGGVTIATGQSGAGGASGDLTLSISHGGGATPGRWKLDGNGTALADANNGQSVTYGAAVGPGGAAVSIKRWIPVTVDGIDGWIPHFGV